MASIKVNTDLAIAAANNIKNANSQIRDGFPKVQRAINQLDNSWDGSAATNAISKFNEMQSKYVDARYKVVDNYVNFLLQQVGEGYAQTEEANISLADAFK